MKNKKGNVPATFQFVARYPSAMLVAGGILMKILGYGDWAFFLIAAGIILHVFWLIR